MCSIGQFIGFIVVGPWLISQSHDSDSANHQHAIRHGDLSEEPWTKASGLLARDQWLGSAAIWPIACEDIGLCIALWQVMCLQRESSTEQARL